MTGTLLRSQEQIALSAQSNAADFYNCSEEDVFFCPEESQFYSHCLERLVFSHCKPSDQVVEFGCGDGSPVINALLRTPFNGTIYGYELNPSACEIANSRITRYKLDQKYTVYNHSFFDAHHSDAHYLIANPPYLPAIDNDICMPLLHGGTDGATITNRLLTLGYPSAMLLVSSYSNPVGTIALALEQGYNVADFMVTPLTFGYYSSEPKVRDQIAKLRGDRKAFYSKNLYFLAGVLFQKQDIAKADWSAELLRTLTAL
ncbi:methyltransferase [Oscillatoria sp. FACHB-1407]|uniref:methyltransferase n=1 Tax=Oscillatoria sp. FACHB-1407 TaxID=2692847 RepID=UPI001F54DDFB|nr:methyltransferase [Oscillatoria sp. FACHB-1407]